MALGANDSDTGAEGYMNTWRVGVRFAAAPANDLSGIRLQTGMTGNTKWVRNLVLAILLAPTFSFAVGTAQAPGSRVTRRHPAVAALEVGAPHAARRHATVPDGAEPDLQTGHL